MFSWLNSDTFLKVSSVITALAAALVQVLPQHTIGYHVAQTVVGLGAAHGVASTVSREQKSP